MKRILFFKFQVQAITAAAAVLFVLAACVNKPDGKYGVVTINFESSLRPARTARSIGTNGLPELGSTAMRIDITGENISPVQEEIGKNDPKIFSVSLPVGETVHIKVSLITPSAIWTGETDITVQEGDNEAAVKLNKIIASMRPLLFSVEGSAPPYTYKINMSGLSLTKNTISPYPNSTPLFTRDGKGRLYISYNEGSANWKIDRYTAEGDPKDTIELTGYTEIRSLTTDLATGKVYTANRDSIHEIDDNGTLTPITPSVAAVGWNIIDTIAVYNGFLFVYSTPIAGNKLTMYKIDSTHTAVQKGRDVPDPLKDIILIENSGSHKNGICNDMFAYGNKVYTVFTINAPYNNDSFYGGILELTYTESGLSARPTGKYGFGTITLRDGVYVPQDGCFYGAKCIIGFEDGILYIADDGALWRKTSVFTAEKNINRIAALDTRSGFLRFEDTDAKWYKEW